MLSLRSTLILLSLAPCNLLLFNDLVIKYFPPPHDGALWHYDDLFKMIVFTPLQVFLVYSIDSNMKCTDSLLSYILVSVYTFGFGVNQSCNAIDSYFRRMQIRASPEVDAAVYFWDEKIGHIISAVAFFAFQIRWLSIINSSLDKSKTQR